MNLEEELAGEHSSVLNLHIGRVIRSRNVPTLRSRMRFELRGALRPITLPLPLDRRSVVIRGRHAAAMRPRFAVTTLSPTIISRRSISLN